MTHTPLLAIVNRAVSRRKTRRGHPDSLGFALLKLCRPFSLPHYFRIRWRAMMASDKPFCSAWRAVPLGAYLPRGMLVLLGTRQRGGPRSDSREAELAQDRGWLASRCECAALRVFNPFSVEWGSHQGAFSFLAAPISSPVLPTPSSREDLISRLPRAVESMSDCRTENKWYLSLDWRQLATDYGQCQPFILGALDTEERRR